MKSRRVIFALISGTVGIATILGSASTPPKNWNAEIGKYTFDQLVKEKHMPINPSGELAARKSGNMLFETEQHKEANGDIALMYAVSLPVVSSAGQSGLMVSCEVFTFNSQKMLKGYKELPSHFAAGATGTGIALCGTP